MKKHIKRISLLDLILGLIIFIIIAILIISIVGIFYNASNSIDEGTVIDKNYRAAYNTVNTIHTGKSTVLIPVNHPESYTLTIQGEKDGRTVEYTFNITEQEFFQYKIGDYYKK